MNLENLDDLKERLKYAGFDTQLNKDLEDKIKAQEPEFLLKHQTKIGESEMEYALHFKQGDKNERYFFNGYDAVLIKPGENEQGMRQYFYANQNITAKEAYNLLDGRAVNKTYHNYEKVEENGQEKYKRTDQTYNTWIELDFAKKDANNNFELQKYGEKYRFDIESKMKQLSITEMQDPEAAKRLIGSLKKGNLQEATLERDGVKEKVLLAANPVNWEIKAYDKNMNQIDAKELKLNKKKGENTAGEDQKKSQRQTNNTAENETKRNKIKR